MKAKKFTWVRFLYGFHVVSIMPILMPLAAFAMNEELAEGKEHHILMVKSWEGEVTQQKVRLQRNLGTANQDRNVQALFNSYMQKAAHHYHLGERDNQLLCYKDILNIPALPDISVARTHVNISVVYLQLDRILLAAAHAAKAESIVPVKDIEKAIGSETVSVFFNSYFKAARLLYSSAPDQALIYLQKVLQLPKQEESLYVPVHLDLAVCHDRLLNFNDSLHHALQILKAKSLIPENRDRALCYASIGSKETNQPEACIRYFKQIENLKHLANTERYLVLSAVGNSYLKKDHWEEGVRFGEQALEALDPCSPQYLFAKHNIATTYGENGNKRKEMELYAEVLESMRGQNFDPSWQKNMRSIQMSIETVFFMKEMDKFEKHLREDLHQKIKKRQEIQKEEEIIRKQEKEKSKEHAHRKLIEEIKAVQRQAVEREKRLEQEKIQRLEMEQKRAAARKAYIASVEPQTILEQPRVPKITQPLPNTVKTKVKTRSITVSSETQETAVEDTPKIIAPTLPALGTRAQAVFDQIADEDWNFTREEYSCYLEDLQCTRRETGSSHRVFQLPKTLTISLKKNGKEIQEELYVADKDVKLGSATLPAWKGKFAPFYLRKQIRNIHEKIITIYTKYTRQVKDSQLKILPHLM